MRLDDPNDPRQCGKEYDFLTNRIAYGQAVAVVITSTNRAGACALPMRPDDILPG
jgi:hypothetical protein